MGNRASGWAARNVGHSYFSTVSRPGRHASAPGSVSTAVILSMVQMNKFRKRKFPAWLAAIAMLAALLFPMKFSAAQEQEIGPPCTHLSSDAMTPDVPAGDPPDESCGDSMRCTFHCSALMRAPVFHLHFTPSAKPNTVAASRPSWLERPEHPPPIV